MKDTKCTNQSKMGALKLPFAPLEPSSLRLLSGPVSPASPKTPNRSRFLLPALPSPRSFSFSSNPSSNSIPLSLKAGVPAPPDRMPWIWSCHKCHARYPLGATRRCLHDGHFFCGGMTVDKRTGRTKKHKACASEFDYLGWEDYGSWQRKVAGRRSSTNNLLDKPTHKHCEKECEFPSACHWKARHSPRKEANFDFLNESQKISPASEKRESSPNPKKTGIYLNRLVKAAEKRTSQFTTLLSTIEDESNFAFTPGFIAASTDKAPKLPELNLTFPVMDFSAIKQGLDDNQKESKDGLPKPIIPQSPPPQMSALSEAISPMRSPPDVDMTDWLSEDTTSSPAESNIDDVPFDFSIDRPSSPSPSSSPSTEDESPMSGKEAWDWTGGDIGIALSSPGKTVHDEIWDEQMNDVEGMWERTAFGSKLERQVGV